MRKFGYLLVCFCLALGLAVSTGCKKEKAVNEELGAPVEEVAPEEEAPYPEEEAPYPEE